eukprot:4672862-Amphidinium_carterae.1
MLSGRSTVVCTCVTAEKDAEQIIDQCCSRLAIQRSGKEALIHGNKVLPATAKVGSWPGLRPAGEVSEYQLIL